MINSSTDLKQRIKKIWGDTKNLLLFAFLLLSFHNISNAFILTMTHSGQARDYSLSWDAVQPSTDTAKVYYYVFEEFDNDTIHDTSFNCAIGVTDTTGMKLTVGSGSRCFVVKSSDTANGKGFTSNVECHGFLHNLTSEGIARADGDGTQRGVNQRWDFTYSLDRDALVTARIYPPGTLFTRDANGFIISASSPVVKTLVEDTPRSSDMAAHNITMQETWDSRSTSSIVQNGIYYLVLTAKVDSGTFDNRTPPFESVCSASRETFLRYSEYFTVPVDIIRILNLTATGIDSTNNKSIISYDITADALVRVVIAKPGSAFVVDGNGEAQPTDKSTGVIDTSLVVSSFTYHRKAGTNKEGWDGTSSTGTAMPSGNYVVAVTASDDYGNHALDASNNDYLITTQISLEKTAGSDSGTTTRTSDTTGPTITVSPTNGASSNSSVSTITVTLADTASSIDLTTTRTSLLLKLPNGSNLKESSGGFTVTTSSSNVLILTAFSTPLNSNGTYNLTGTGYDAVGNRTSIDVSFTIDIKLGAAFTQSLKIYPNPAKNLDPTIQFDLAVDATVSVDIYNILGERVSSSGDVAYTARNGGSIIWDRRGKDGSYVGSGLYLVKIKATSSSGTVETTKKLVIVE